MDKNIVDSYRQAYKKYFGTETHLPDDEIWRLYGTSRVFPTREAQDNYVLEEIHFATLGVTS